MTVTQNNSFFKHDALINGQWRRAQSGATFAVMNPATSLLLAEVPNLGREETTEAILAANDAFFPWKNTMPRDRAFLLMRWADLIAEHADELATLITMEQGKVIMEARQEVLSSVNNIRWNAEECKRLFGETIPSHRPDLRFMTLYQPDGVVGVITAWNFPLSLAARKLSAALGAGCTAVAKPSEETPLTMLAMAHLAQEAGFPAGVLNVITTMDSVSVGAAMMQDPLVKHLTFTGSTAVGKIIMRQAADTVKKLTLELGGNAPAIVFEDACLDKAIADLLGFKWSNAGQICTNVNRFLIQRSIISPVLALIQGAMDKINVGNGLDPKITMGPLINQAAVKRLQALIEDAKLQGACVVRGGSPHALGHTFFEPTLLTAVTSTMRLAQEELFGPVIAIYPFDTEEEALALANHTDYGLASYLYTNDYGRILRMSEALAYGGVSINTTDYSYEAVPFGGIKASGIGREGGRMGIRAFLEAKTLCLCF